MLYAMVKLKNNLSVLLVGAVGFLRSSYIDLQTVSVLLGYIDIQTVSVLLELWWLLDAFML